MSERARGHTLVELLVALCLLSLLSAGLLRFLGTSLAALARVEEALATQRSLRRATALLTEDLAGMGFFVPCRDAPSGRTWFQVASQRPLQQLSGRALTPLPPGQAGDELTFLQDVLLPGGAVLARALAAGASLGPSCGVAVAAGRRTRLQAGDLLLIEDGRWEAARVVEGVTLQPGRIVELPAAPMAEEGCAVFRRDHAEGAPVALLRPLRVVQYRLVLLHKGTLAPPAPALVRLETGCGTACGAMPDWAGLLKGGPEAQTSMRVVAERITGFQVDLPRGPGDPVPGLVRVRLEAQGPRGLRREATLLCAPRNGPGRL